MAHIQERRGRDGKMAYRVQVRLKGHPTQTATFDRKTDANKWAAQTESAIREGRYFQTSEAKRHLFREMIERYERDVLPQKPKMARDQRVQLKWWNERLGDYTLADVTPAVIAEQRDILADGSTPRGGKRSNATVNRYLAALSHCYTIAMNEWGWVAENPLRKVNKRKEPRGRVRFLTDEEREKLLKACQASRDQALYPVVVLALSTGMRKSEIMNLRWGDADLQQGRIVLHETKNDERRAVPVVGLARDVLRGLSRMRRIDTDLVFPARTYSNGRDAVPVDIRRAWVNAVERAELEDLRFHDLRHSCASYLAMNGATLAEIAEVLGHKTLQMVKRYAHLSEAHTSKVVERMNAQIFHAADAQHQVTGRTER